MTAAELATPELQPIEIEPRPCEYCGSTIDQHECRDLGEGPEFFCYPDDDLVKQWELADPRDRWKHTGEPAPPSAFRNVDFPATLAPIRQHYRTPQATVDAFWYVVSLCKPEYLKAWLADHPRDTPYLLKLLENK
jgi:hypothetical protein